MTDMTFADTIKERREAIEKVVAQIVKEGREEDLRDLRILLINVMSLLKRDPGIEFAIDDLYAAATVLVKDASAGVLPGGRRLRFVRDGLERLCARLPGAAERLGVAEETRYRGLEAFYAVQLERRSDGLSVPALSSLRAA